jgi:hypothetical protein
VQLEPNISRRVTLSYRGSDSLYAWILSSSSPPRAQVVHIDLGIAFEQGLLLPTPEQVPFRLTRDLVDGMGVTGCEGVMRRCSENVLRVLRAHREELLTIAEVLRSPQCKTCAGARLPVHTSHHPHSMRGDEGGYYVI